MATENERVPLSTGVSQPSTSMGAVFLSYASQDGEAAKRICEALRAGGIEVWFDQSELRGGDAWDRQIRKQIHDCALFAPIISQHTHERLEGYFRREWRLAIERAGDMAENKAFLVPIVIDSTTERDPSVPEKFRELQWSRLPDGQVSPAFIQRVRRLLSSVEADALTTAWPRPSQVSASMQTAVSTRQQWGTKRALPVAAAVVVLVALTYFTIVKFWASKHPASPSAPTSVSASAAPAAFAPPPHSIAVLPFVNMSGDRDQEYFSDGLTEELLNSLARISELQVAARTSAFSFKGKDTDIGTIARRLNVAAILEGSVRRSGHTIRITAQLNNAVTGYHLWSQTYDRDLGDVLKLQTEISNAVAEALKVTLLGAVAAKLEIGGTNDPAALDAYLRGLRLSRDAAEEGNARAAIEAFGEAIRVDSGYALAFAGRSLALSSYLKYFVGRVGHDTLADQAKADAERSVALAPGLAEGHIALSNVLEWHFLEFGPAVEHCERALALAPGSALVVRWCSGVAADMGRFDEAIAAARHGVALDPLNPLTHLWLADALQKARRYEESISVYRETLALDPRYLAPVYAQQGLSFYLLGDLQRARKICETSPQDWQSWVCLAVTYHKLGQRREAEAQIPKLVNLPVRHGGSSDSMAYQYAQIDAQWGDQEKAVVWLEKAVRMRDSGLPNLKTDPLLDPLRNEPRFQAIELALKFAQ